MLPATHGSWQHQQQRQRLPSSSAASDAGSMSSSAVGAGGFGMSFSDEDVTARLVRKMLRVAKWTPDQLAHRLSVPATCVEACVAHEASSQLLRSQLRQWIRKGHGLPPLPQVELQMLVRDADARELTTADDSVFAMLDDATREHFEYLQQSIGHNFVSILNDPDAKQTAAWGSTGNEWGSWLGKAFGGGGQASGGHTADGGGGGAAGGSFFESAAAAAAGAAMADGAPTDFAEYLDGVASAYRARRELIESDDGRAAVRLPGEAAAAAAAEEAEGGVDGCLPLPDGVPYEFASDTYDPARILRAVSRDSAGSPLRDDDGLQHSGWEGSAKASSSSAGAATGGDDDTPPPPVDPRRAAEALERDAATLGAVKMTLRSLEQHHDAVAASLMGHVHARSRDFFAASQLFEQLSNETRAALSTADETRRDVQEGGSQLMHSFLRIAQLSRRRRNTAALQAVLGALHRHRAVAHRVDQCIEENRLADAVAALAAADDDANRRYEAAAAAAAEETTTQTAEADANAAYSGLPAEAFAALDATLARVAARRRQLGPAIVEDVRRVIKFEDWDVLDWEALGDSLHAAHRLGGLADVLAAYDAEAGIGAADAVLHTLVKGQAVPLSTSVRAIRAEVDDPTSERDVREGIKAAARAAVARGVHLLKPAAFTAMLLDALAAQVEHLKYCLGHARLVVEAMDAAASRAAATTSPSTAAEASSSVAGGAFEGSRSGPPGAAAPAGDVVLRSVLSAVCAAAQDCIVWFFDGRDDESVVNFGPSAIDRFVGDVLARVAEFEQLATHEWLALGGDPGRGAPGLWQRVRGCLGQHVKVYFKRHHNRLLDRMIMVLGAETWEAQQAVAPVFNTFVATLAASDDATVGFSIAHAHNISGKPDELPKSHHAHHQQLPFSSSTTNGAPQPVAASPSASASPAPESEPHAAVQQHQLLAFPGLDANPDDAPGGDGQKSAGGSSNSEASALLVVPPGQDAYVATNSVLILLQMLAEYDWFGRRFPLLSYDVAACTQDALRLFDGQCHSLVLGGGAVDQGVMASVSPVHVAVASQSLALLAALTPRLQRRLARLSNAKAMAHTKNLERVCRDLVEHRNAFVERLVDLFRSRIREAKLEPAQWAVANKGNEWIMGLLRECLRFWRKVLLPILGKNAVAERSVVIGFVNVMSQRIRDVASRVDTAEAVARVHDDLIVYKTNVENLLGFGVVACGAAPTVAAAANATAAKLTPGTSETNGAVLDFLGCGAALGV